MYFSDTVLFEMKNNYTSITQEHVDALQQLLGPTKIFTDLETRKNYGRDYTEDLEFPPNVVVKPENVHEVSAVVRYCNSNKIPVIPVGARTGLSGGMLAVYGGVAVSMEKFNKILEIDTNNLQATVEPGVITEVFQDEVKKVGLFYPPDPSSKGSCFLGGNLGESSGGPKAVKYGVTKDYVLNLEVVLPNGEIIFTGANVLKNATGYNLTQLMIGSEGTLGIITKIVFKLIPLPKYDKLILAPFKNAEDACAAVAAIFKKGITPSALEFLERDAILFTVKYTPDLHFDLPDSVAAHLLVEVDGNNEDVLMQDIEQIAEVLYEYNCDEVLFAEDAAQKENLWKIRRKVGEAVKSHSIYKEEDTVVPRFELPKLLKGVKAIGEKYGFQSVCYGHAGDGNLHINIIKGNLSEEAWNVSTKQGIVELFELTKNLGGTISGEHGIGLVQKEYLPIVFNETQMNLQKGIKHIFDPNGIMNPGKIFPD